MGKGDFMANATKHYVEPTYTVTNLTPDDMAVLRLALQAYQREHRAWLDRYRTDYLVRSQELWSMLEQAERQ